MSKDLKVSKEAVYSYIDFLEMAGLIHGILQSKKGYRLIRKPSKIYLENTNLLRAIVGQIGATYEIGTIRESFFANQIKNAGLNIQSYNKGDFLVEGKYIFEIGGKNKQEKQIRGEKNAFIIRDGIKVGHGNIIPLWLFGFLY